MTDHQKLSSLPPTRSSQNFAALREKGITLISQLAQTSWTDHNVHDPGITFLEAFAYALTDIGLRTQLEIADLLRSGEKYAASDLPAAHQVLPCAPVTFADLRKVLLDHYLIKEAAISTDVDNEVAFYYDSSVNPPWSYLPADNRVQLHGLYEVLVEFNDSALNSNSYPINIEYNSRNYTLDIALPHWDESEALAFQAALTINAVTLLDSGAGVWRALEENQTFFAQLVVDYSDANGAGSQQLWIVLRVVQAVQPLATLMLLLDEVALTLVDTGINSLLSQFSARVFAARNSVTVIQHYLNHWRNLSQVPLRIAVVREQDIAVRARIEVNSDIDLELLVAKIFFTLDTELSPSSNYHSLTQLQELGLSSSEIYDGPLLQHGFILNTDNATSLGTDAVQEIYTSDIMRLIMRLRSSSASDVTVQESIVGRDILAVSDLTLSNYINNRLITEGATDCLRLVEVTHYRPKLSPAKSDIILMRDEIVVSYDFVRVEQLFAQLHSEALANTISESPNNIWPVTLGDEYAIADYYPFQNELPRIYGVGNMGLPDSASTERKAQALQTKAYLLLAEQFLADSAALLANINRFFSASADENMSYFVQPLYELSDLDKLVKSFPANGDWQTFSLDSNNAYQRALQQAIENHQQLIDRRNRMLDHLLARHGVEALAWSQELHRWSYQLLKDANLTTTQFQHQLTTRRLEVNARLIKMKAALLADVPTLNANRFQAFGQIAQYRPELISVIENAGTYSWQLLLEHIVLQTVTNSSSKADAYIQAQVAQVLATQILYYQVESAGGGRHRYVLRDGPDSSNQVIANSARTWSSIAATETAINQTVAAFVQLTVDTSLSAMERFIAHQCGFNPHQRRRLLINSNHYFEIYDELDTDAIIEKRWRLWQRAGYSGSVVLSSVFHVTAPAEIVDPLQQHIIATDLAQAVIDQVIHYGLHEWNYVISPAGAQTFNFDLRSTAGEMIALHSSPLPSIASVQAHIKQTATQIQTLFSAEGFHLVEHLLLRPQQTGETFLTTETNTASNSTAAASDNYSHQISLVFPSGFARDFDQPEETVTRSEVTPHRFRDLEFRQYVQRVVAQTCPAHILPSLYWVDQQLPGSSDDAGSFNSFETRYFNWLQTQLTAGSSALDLDNNRIRLIESLNAIANE